MFDFTTYEVLTFDCYGTLIDWEKGILNALRPVLAAHDCHLADEHILSLYATIESEIEAGPYVTYREVLRSVVREFGRRLGFRPTPTERECLVDSLKDWPPFPDTIDALPKLKQAYRLAIISNVDDDLFALSARALPVEFDAIITAEQVRSYKPSLRNFQMAIDRIGVPPDRILHVAQSLYHDIVPARRLGLATVWVNRHKEKKGWGATPPASSRPDLEVPDLRALVSLMRR
ncbi:MAG: haloacid dehalogenase type II [Acidobacteria bacterium]|nr:MAG: haloacid dehalogenase type II [Acidobacteriota bacterium]